MGDRPGVNPCACVTSGKFLYILESQFYHLQNGSINRHHLSGVSV